MEPASRCRYVCVFFLIFLHLFLDHLSHTCTIDEHMMQHSRPDNRVLDHMMTATFSKRRGRTGVTSGGARRLKDEHKVKGDLKEWAEDKHVYNDNWLGGDQADEYDQVEEDLVIDEDR